MVEKPTTLVESSVAGLLSSLKQDEGWTKRVGKKRFKSMIYQDFSVYFALLLDLFVCLLYYKVNIGGELKR